MSHSHGVLATAVPLSTDEREMILEQLNRLLETHHFKNSRRYPALLRFIVEETLEGRGDILKERLLGIRVFDRPADYDTAADPIVRVTIAEIRKRIAQYYHDEDHDSELRIELLPGSYAPEFRFRNGRAEPPSEVHSTAVAARSKEAASVELEIPAPPSAPSKNNSRLSWMARPAVASLAVALLFLAALLAFRWTRPSAVDQLWAPVFAAQHTILFCIPTDVGEKRGGPYGLVSTQDPSQALPATTAGGPTFLDHEALGENVVYSDMLATVKISNVLALHHRDYRVKLNRYTNLEDLRQGPAILIGGLDNQWTMRALAPLRFHFAGSDEDRYWIADAKDPANRNLSLDLKVKYAAVTRDYAIVARLHNPQTGQLQIVIAGIGMSGTAAAGEFLCDDSSLKDLRRRLGGSFADQDFEVVLSTDVVNGMAGAPKIVAVTAW